MKQDNLFHEPDLQKNRSDIKQYLLQINRIKLKDYVNSGLILPDTYLSDDCEKDIQSKNKNFLVFSDGYLRDLDESQILIDIILTDSEKEKLHRLGEVYYADFPIPISRIKKIYVQDTKVLKHILVTMETSENGTLSKALFDTYAKGKNIFFEKREYKMLSEDLSNNNYTEQIKMFDKRMGMFSFMKNTNFYYADDTGVASIYSNNYFKFQKLLEEQEYQEIKIFKEHQDFSDILYSDKQIDKEFLISFSESIVDQEIKELFLNFLKPTGSRNIIKEFAEKNLDIYYLIGLLYYFRQRDDSNKLDNLKSDIQDLIPYNKAELSLAILGLYYGYSRLRSHENIEFQDKVFHELFGSKFNIKFEMNSKLDYITVESLYQLCFNTKDKKGYEFEYLEYPIYKSTINSIKDKKLAKWYSIDKSEIYFDVINFKVKKLSTLEMFGKLLGKYSGLMVENKQSGYLMVFVQYNFCDILKVNENGQKYFLKKDLLERLENQDTNLHNVLFDVLTIGQN